MIKLILPVITLALKIALASPPQQVATVKPAPIKPFPIYYPPAEFDRPYGGELTIVTAQSAAEVQKACRDVPAVLGCSERFATRCTITLAPDSVLKAVGWTREAIIRHETAHCNGWHADHRGWRLTER